MAQGNRSAVSHPELTPAEAACCCAEKRQAEAARIRDKYPDRIPVSPSTLCPAGLTVLAARLDA